MTEKNFFLHIRFGLGVYIVRAKNGIFLIFSALAISKKVLISDISGQTLVRKTPIIKNLGVIFCSLKDDFRINAQERLIGSQM